MADRDPQHNGNGKAMKSLEALLRTFVELHPEDAARAFESLEAGERIRLFKTLPPRIAFGVIAANQPARCRAACFRTGGRPGRRIAARSAAASRVNDLASVRRRDSRAISVGIARRCVAVAAQSWLATPTTPRAESWSRESHRSPVI